MSRIPLGVLGLMLSVAASTMGQALPDCGGLGERSCRPFDKEFWSMSKLTCEHDLALKGTKCKDDRRWTQPGGAGWTGWALREQRDNIQGTLPLNWVTHFGTHNSYSSIRQGFTNAASANQYYSITDQLQLGARFLRLDPHWYLDNLWLCHGDVTALCPATSSGRLYAMAIKEIAGWLRHNDEVIVLYIKDSDYAGSDKPREHPEHILAPVRKWLGDLVFRPGDWPRNQADWPTLAELRRMGKRVVIFAKHDYSHVGDNYYSESSSGTQWFFKYGSYFAGAFKSYRVDEFRAGSCSTAGIDDTRKRPRTAWWFIGEGRTASDLVDPTGFLDAAAVRNAVACGASYLGVDFLMALDKAPTAIMRAPDDTRRDASIWSWKEGEYAYAGPALMKHSDGGRWTADTPNATYPFACGKRGDVQRPWRVTEWRITATPRVWYEGEGQCRTLNSGADAGWTFAAPRTAEENARLWSSASAANVPTGSVWLNYSARPVPEPLPLPAYLSFDMVRGGAIPLDETVTLFSGPDVAWAVETVDHPFLIVSRLSGVSQPQGVPVDVRLDRRVISSLGAGSYTGSLRFEGASRPAAADPNEPVVKRNPGYVSSHLHIYEPTTSRIEIVNEQPILTGTDAEVKITVTSPRQTVNDYTTGIVRLVRIYDLEQDGVARKTIQVLGEEQLQPRNNLVSYATFKVRLEPGVHVLAGGYLGDDKHVGSETGELLVRIAGQAVVTPEEAKTIEYVIGGSLPVTPRYRTFDSLTQEPIESTWLVRGSTPKGGWIAMSHAVGSVSSPYLLQPALDEIGPVYLDAWFDCTRNDVSTSIRRDVTVKVMVPSFDALPSLLNVTTGVRHTQEVRLHSRYLIPVSARATTSDGKPWLRVTTHGERASYATVDLDPTGMPPGTYRGTLVFSSQFVKAGAATVPVVMTVEQPVRVQIGTNVQHPGVRVKINGQTHALPYTGDSYKGATLEIEPDYQSNELLRFTFASWSDGAPARRNVSVGAGPLTLQMNTYRDYQVRTSITGSGTVTLTPASADGFYREGTVVRVEAKPAFGWMFHGYSNALTGLTPVQNLTVTLVHMVNASFGKVF